MTDTTVLEDVNTEGAPVDTKERERAERRARAEQAPPTTDLPATTNWAQVADAARGMSTGRASIPSYLRNTWGDCMAIFDIALRAGLSPYMLARQTYEQNGMMCFMSQAYHALAAPYIRGPLLCEYEGEGPDRVCIVKGRLKDDPDKQLLVHRSPRLADRHPGFSLKENPEAKTGKKLSYAEGMELIAKAEGKKVQGLFSNGSPLWISKPDMQLWYDTNRDWIRKYCPRAVLGIYTPDEVEEFAPEMKDVTPPLTERLAAARAMTGEGFSAGHAERELAAVAADVDVDLDAPSPPQDAAKGRADEVKLKAAAIKAKGGPNKAAVKAAADRAEKKSAETARKVAKENGLPHDAKSYLQHWEVAVENAVDAVALKTQWYGEQARRRDLGVTLPKALEMQKKVNAKIEALGGKV